MEDRIKNAVYISGPMTGYKDKNKQSFYEAEDFLRKLGFTDIINPAKLEQAKVDFSHADYMRRDLVELLKCEYIYLLPGWENSKGATAEKFVADTCNILEIAFDE